MTMYVKMGMCSWLIPGPLEVKELLILGARADPVFRSEQGHNPICVKQWYMVTGILFPEQCYKHYILSNL